jgi:hypothetical protein
MSANDRRRLARALADGISEERLNDLLESLSITDDRSSKVTSKSLTGMRQFGRMKDRRYRGPIFS